MIQCQDWNAWRDRMPRRPPTIIVTGTCTAPDTGFGIELREPGPATADGSRPAIAGPAVAVRSGPPPAFQVDPRDNPFYLVEIASEPRLFDRDNHAHERRPENFYSSWPSESLLSDDAYTLPPLAWDALKRKDTLFYRVLTTASR